MYFGTVHFPVISLENWEHGQENGEVLTSFSYSKHTATTTSHDVETASTDMKKYAGIASLFGICMVLPQSLKMSEIVLIIYEHSITDILRQ